MNFAITCRARLALLAVASSLALAGGCAEAAHEPVPLAAQAGLVKGMVYISGQEQLPKGAAVKVELIDATDLRKIRVISHFEKDAKTLPVEFALKFEPEEIREGRVYQVRAQLTAEGRKPWRHEQAYAVLTGNNPAYVEVRLAPSW